MTILTEFMDQVDISSPPPTHMFLQAGVGSFSGADIPITSISTLTSDPRLSGGPPAAPVPRPHPQDCDCGAQGGGLLLPVSSGQCRQAANQRPSC